MQWSPYSPAKIARPRFKKVLHRETLFETLDQHRDYPAIWINGPAGSGKTTLVSSYIEQRHLTALWYQLDPGDHEVATFFHYLAMAEQLHTHGRTKPLPVYTPDYAKSIDLFSKRFFEALYGRLQKSSVLVLDNYHEVPNDGPFHDVIRKGVSAIPEGINLIMLSRSGPPANLTRARANNRLKTIGWQELRLDRDETRRMVDLFSSKAYSDRDTHLIHEKVDGWLAGLMLILQSSEYEGFQIRSLAEYTPKIIFDYFADEILDHTDSISHDILLTTAIFPRMTAQMAKELSSIPNAGQILSRLSRENFFTNERPGESPTYQFHPLFREFLLAKCHIHYSSERMQALKQKAAYLLELNGQVESAAALYREAGDYHGLIKLILSQSSPLLFQGRYQTLTRWMNSLPEGELLKEPWLLYWLAMSLINTDPNQSRRLFEQAFSLFKTHNNTIGMLSTFCGVSDSIFQCFEQFDRYNELFPRLETFCRNLESLSSPEIELRVIGTMLMALCARQPFHPDLKHWQQRAFLSLEKEIPVGAKIQLVISLIMCKVHSGELAETGHLLAMYREKSDDGEVVPYALIFLNVLDSFFSWLNGHFEQSNKAHRKALKLSSAMGNYNSILFVLAHRVANALSTGDLSAADKVLNKLERQLDQFGAWEKRFFHVLACWRALLENNVAQAALHSERSVLLAEKKEGKGLLQTVPVSYLGRAICLHAMGNEKQAARCVDMAISQCERFKALQVEYGCHLARAHLALDINDEDAALTSLTTAMRIGREQGYVNTYFWRSDVMSKLCARALEEGIEPEYVRSLIRQRKLFPQNCLTEIEQWPWPVRIITLNGFKLFIDDQPLQFTRKAQHKPLALLKVLIALGGHGVPDSQVADSLWPDSEGDAAHWSIATTLRRLRKLLNHPEAIRLRDKRLTIDQAICWTDTQVFERIINNIKQLEPADSDAKRLRGIELAEKALDMYQGHFLDNEASSAAVIAKREQLRRSFLKTIGWLGMQYEGMHDWERATDCYEYGLNIEASAEVLYRRLMQCHQRLGHKAEALKVYDRCCNMMSADFGSCPSPETEAIRKCILADP
jgi:ATP/maltotriose-dependent transcriptional regulator MalT/DNA-binding SARP family transcriptional activator